MPAHTAEVLRQVEGAGVIEGGWVGGDAWFGSVMTCVEVKKRFGVYSTFIVKGNDKFFPVGVLHSVLTARHGTRPAGHWVTMTATISDVQVIALAYAWSQKGVSYFVSTCGSTEPSDVKYQSKFEDEWGNTNVREINRPNLAHFFYQYSPLIDEHNKQRQSLLSLEKRWLTKDPWFRLLTTLVGMATVDMHRLYRHYMINVQQALHKTVDSIGIVKFTDLICGGLRRWQYMLNRRSPLGVSDVKLSRILDENNRKDRPPTQKQQEQGKKVGNAITATCFICRRYVINGTSFQQTTSWWCFNCHMPLCNVPRNGDGTFRELTCLEEHLSSNDPTIGCGQMHVKGTEVPKHLHVEINKRKSKRKKT
jgi:hypothetical protein